MQSIFEFVQQQRNNYRTETIEITPGYDYSQYNTLRTIELYHNSKFETGNLDTLKRVACQSCWQMSASCSRIQRCAG